MDGLCAPGYYCVASVSGPKARACPAATYGPSTGLRAEVQCSVCPAGSFCPLGSPQPTACPAGSYCVYGSGVHEPCPLGSYSNKTGLRNVEGCGHCDAGSYCDQLGPSRRY